MSPYPHVPMRGEAIGLGCPVGHRPVAPLLHDGAMTDYDTTDGGRRRIISEDQAKHLREHAETMAARFDQLLASGDVGCVLRGKSLLDRFDDEFSHAREESQDPDLECLA